MMFREITVQRIAAGTLFKLAGIGLVLSLVPFTLLMGCLSLFGASTLTWNNEPITGVSGLVASPFIGLFMAAVFTMFLGACMTLGLWVYTRFRPLTLLVKVPGDGPAPNNSSKPTPLRGAA